MNIYKVTGRTCSTEVAGHRKATGKDTFSEVLDKCMDAVHPDQGLKEVSGAMTEAISAASCETSNTQGAVLQQAFKVVDVLEEYAEALNNPQTTLKSIEPVVTRLQQELKELDVQSVHHTSEEQDDELAKVVNRIAITGTVEAFKFQRGDYIA